MFNKTEFQYVRVGSRQGPRYRHNGTGRDCYIAQGPGMNPEQTNLSHQMEITGQKIRLGTSNGWNFSAGTATGGARPCRTASTHSYHTNGTGRDTYISQNSGGYIRSFGGHRLNYPDTFFKSTLRDYEVSVNPDEYFSHIDCQKYGQLWRNPTDFRKSMDLAKTQSSLNKRLSQPKKDFQVVRQKGEPIKKADMYEKTAHGVKRLRPQTAGNLRHNRSNTYNNFGTDRINTENSYKQVKEQYMKTSRPGTCAPGGQRGNSANNNTRGKRQQRQRGVSQSDSFQQAQQLVNNALGGKEENEENREFQDQNQFYRNENLKVDGGKRHKRGQSYQF